ncbi:DsbA family oxidoreductase [Robertkochia flava]|uniref:DsbA family oxidoreductase n=1 Tax=Robertkochia flava TaxID=3447986 RepID=UPI001CCD74C4|nr:DsbA family oxidoreductase [Robertkochia marina]
MKIEIWSDVACPWCYIGKKRFEKALAEFAAAEKIEVEWKSFLLNPDQVTDPEESLTGYLAREKGLSEAQVIEMMDQVARVGRSEGIDFDFNKVVVANTVRAHALLQMAKEKGLGQEIKQGLLKAYFSESVNVDNPDELIAIGVKAGLDAAEIKEYLSTDTPFRKVEKEIREAQALGVKGVPFFVIDRKYGISGAQESQVFSQALEKSFEEWKNAQGAPLDITEGQNCNKDEGC